MSDTNTVDNTPAPDPNAATTVDPVAPLIEPTDVPNMSNKDINEVSGDGLKKNVTDQRAHMAEGLQQARDQAKGKDVPEPNPFAQGPGSDIA